MKNNSALIGKIIATEKAPTTIDYFGFWTKKDLVLNPFDIVKVSHVDKSFTYGMIEDIHHITDSASFLTDFISNDFGNPDIKSPTLRIGMNYVSAKVVCNTKNIYIPVQSDSEVYLATPDEVKYALGLENMKSPLCCGYLEMYENTKGSEKVFLPVNLNSKFIIGPEGAHLNISGISGLAAKTSYAMFLMKAIQDRFIENGDKEDDSVAFVMFNVKGCDLLAIDQPNDFSDEDNPINAKQETLDIYARLHMSTEPFKNVHYYYPYSKGHLSNTYLSEEEVELNIKQGKAKFYKYIYQDDRKNLDLLFSNIDDTTQTMDAIISQIIDDRGEFSKIDDWQHFLDKVKEKCSSSDGRRTGIEIPIVSWRKFARIVNKAINDKNPIFARRVDENKNETRLGDALKYIKKNDVHVIDISKLSEDKQSFVFGDVARTIYDLQLGEFSNDPEVNPPSRIIIFIDELNKYASKDSPKNSPILRQILDVAERGRSLGIVLFAAEQFRSAIHDRVTGNCSTHAYGRTNTIELTKSDYKSVPSVYKTMMTRLKQGEYIIQNPIFRSMLSIKFPKPIYRQFKK